MFLVKVNKDKLAASDRFQRKLYQALTVYSIILLLCEILIPVTKTGVMLKFLFNIVPFIAIFLTWQYTTGQSISVVQDPTNPKNNIIVNKFYAPWMIGCRMILAVFFAWEGWIDWYGFIPLLILEIAFLVVTFILGEMYEFKIAVLDEGFAIKFANPEKYEFNNITDEVIDEMIGIVKKEETNNKQGFSRREE